ncbi:hypothetical protein [Streptomyces thermoalcalitolerans]|uniref:hypothetical protein n=1 Tax=Streptomyces thermoalcalitolerans TaxID=65605 RepID=UPI0031DBCEF0
MTNVENPSDAVGRRVREVRERRRLTVQQLSELCAEKAGYELSVQALYNLENGRRDKDGRRRRLVTVDELLALATALNVAPVHLLVDPDSSEPYPVTTLVSAPPPAVRSWIRGLKPLDDTDPRDFYTEVPAVEFGKREEHPERYGWVWDVVKYLTRSMGRLYRRGDGTAVFELELPSRKGGEGGEPGEAAER